ncbi:hypothetical protein AU252_10100 [Pseudarthrobacter sulfonivorans]|uniref:Periplasmic binding protein domain-containing protein n=1 Tax=Pseudarthrobacter sulfonivorans TaxID=121292 RepID=A0A0U3R8D9_9MICC|nr:substrate-binding domain-containing protein [Pseudarthrobacter sulfonivorans]ALV41457.1 hypothetical protein AU252_10100 [Pseudarthrobacter sulfonivorans]
MKRAGLVYFAGFTIISLGLLTGCSGSSNAANTSAGSNASGSGVKIGGVVQNASDPFFVTLMCGASKEAEAEGATMTWKPTNSTSIQELQANLDAVSLTNPGGILMSGSGDSSYNTKIQSLQQTGTPVVVVNVPVIPPVEYAQITSSSDNTDFAHYVAKDIGHGGELGILGGIAGAKIFTSRYQPVIDALGKVAPDVKVLPVQYDDVDRTKAASVASALIVAHPDLKAIYAVSGPEGAGAAAAVKQAGKADKVKVYTYDATPEVVQGLQEGTISAALAQSAYRIGQEGVKAILDYRKANPGTTPVMPDASKNQTIPLKILTKENVNDADSKAFQYVSTCN